MYTIPVLPLSILLNFRVKEGLKEINDNMFSFWFRQRMNIAHAIITY